MMAHPVILAVLALDVVSLFFLCRAAAGAVRIEAGWAPGSSGRGQIRLETTYETGVIAARAALLLMGVSTLILVFGVTNVFPEIVPGAMCGTGVLQATGGQGGRAFVFRLLGIALLYLWSLLEALNRASPDFPLARLNVRMILLATPFSFLAIFDTFGGFGGLDVYTPVDCCTAVYDRVARGGQLLGTGPVNGRLLAPLFAALTFLLLLFGSAGLAAGPKRFGKCSAFTAATALVWAPVAATTLVRVFSPYYYEVLHHYCPWCLFLPEHGFAGFPLFLLLAAATIQGVAAPVLYGASKNHPGVRPAGARKARRAFLRTLVLAVLFTLLAVWPVLSWRLRFGVWMG